MRRAAVMVSAVGWLAWMVMARPVPGGGDLWLPQNKEEAETEFQRLSRLSFDDPSPSSEGTTVANDSAADHDVVDEEEVERGEGDYQPTATAVEAEQPVAAGAVAAESGQTRDVADATEVAERASGEEDAAEGTAEATAERQSDTSVEEEEEEAEGSAQKSERAEDGTSETSRPGSGAGEENNDEDDETLSGSPTSPASASTNDDEVEDVTTPPNDTEGESSVSAAPIAPSSVDDVNDDDDDDAATAPHDSTIAPPSASSSENDVDAPQPRSRTLVLPSKPATTATTTTGKVDDIAAKENMLAAASLETDARPTTTTTDSDPSFGSRLVSRFSAAADAAATSAASWSRNTVIGKVANDDGDGLLEEEKDNEQDEDLPPEIDVE